MSALSASTGFEQETQRFPYSFRYKYSASHFQLVTGVKVRFCGVFVFGILDCFQADRSIELHILGVHFRMLFCVIDIVPKFFGCGCHLRLQLLDQGFQFDAVVAVPFLYGISETLEQQNGAEIDFGQVHRVEMTADEIRVEPRGMASFCRPSREVNVLAHNLTLVFRGNDLEPRLSQFSVREYPSLNKHGASAPGTHLLPAWRKGGRIGDDHYSVLPVPKTGHGVLAIW